MKSRVHALENRADINNQFLNFTGSRQGSIYKCFQLQEIGSVGHICNFAMCTQAESINEINNMYNALVSFTWGTQKQRNEAEVEVQKVKPDITTISAFGYPQLYPQSIDTKLPWDILLDWILHVLCWNRILNLFVYVTNFNDRKQN